MSDQEIVQRSAGQLSEKDFRSAVLSSLQERGLWIEWISDTLLSLVNESFIKTNSWEVYRDNKTVLEAVKLILSMMWVKWAQQQPQIAIFNNMPTKDKPLEY